MDYRLFSVSENQLRILIQEKNFAALNITYPYKEKILPFLDQLDDVAAATLSVNTVLNDHGQLIGYNTDYFGFEQLLAHHKIDLKDKVVAVLGSGGSSKTLQHLIKKLTPHLVVVSRTPTADQYSYEQFRLYPKIDVLINATPLGSFPDIHASPIDLLKLSTHPKTVIDLTYNPYRTKLLIQAEELGCQIANGLWMLLAQAFSSHALFCGTYPINVTIEQLNYGFNKSNNIVLIGMPGCGKSTIGQYLATKLKRDFIDTDVLIAQRENDTTDNIIRNKGIEYFREVEQEVIARLSGVLNAVIASGGGIIEDSRNITALKTFGRVYFIDRPLEELNPDDTHPLSSSQEDLFKLYYRRYNSYDKLSDVKLSNDTSVEETAKKVEENFYANCHN